MVYVLAVAASVTVIAGLSAALYAWFQLSLRRFYAVTARDVLSTWDSRLAELSDHHRDYERSHPPIEVLEAVLALPSRRSKRFELR